MLIKERTERQIKRNSHPCRAEGDVGQAAQGRSTAATNRLRLAGGMALGAIASFSANLSVRKF